MGVLAFLFLAWETALLAPSMAANSALRHFNPATTAFIDRYSQKRSVPVRLEWRKLDEISDFLKRAVIVAEDDTFLEHEGLNLDEMKAAWETNRKRNKTARGGSTITMQLAKNLYLSPSKSYLRKLNEIILAKDIEKKLSKARIMEVYLNVVEWGDGIFGVEAASRHYFRKEAKDLSREEAAYLAAILPNPVYLGTKNVKKAEWRKRMVLRRLHWAVLPEGF